VFGDSILPTLMPLIEVTCTYGSLVLFLFVEKKLKWPELEPFAWLMEKRCGFMFSLLWRYCPGIRLCV
jgi:hypothetical protein